MLYRKHFPYEDYDEWLFGDTGKWASSVDRVPDILGIQVGVSFSQQSYHYFQLINYLVRVCQFNSAFTWIEFSWVSTRAFMHMTTLGKQ
jgi:hypothetical protein